MHRYECGNCQQVSNPFVLRNSAERYGQEHRDERHGGMHPFNEAIVSGGGRMPQPGEWRVFVLFGVLILLGLATKAL
ncbi:hypothetical protein ABZ923_40105 [Streptomyces sp. NPDC046881]|uniref:hypothetical protein n=1 Tax=Streptomyces sp. NPDC046881 TaxID=3155374 RepID=UPI0034093D2B